MYVYQRSGSEPSDAELDGASPFAAPKHASQAAFRSTY